jgi:CRP-like cAMP-binding protein
VSERPEIALQLMRVHRASAPADEHDAGRLDLRRRPGRVAKQLLQLAAEVRLRRGWQLRVTHDLTQEELAQLVGASRETVNKALADFASRGWLRLEGKSVVILDRDRLAKTSSANRRPMLAAAFGGPSHR